jgi:hypothetical protein
MLRFNKKYCSQKDTFSFNQSETNKLAYRTVNWPYDMGPLLISAQQLFPKLKANTHSTLHRMSNSAILRAV